MLKLVIFACFLSTAFAAISKRQAQYYNQNTPSTHQSGPHIPIIRLLNEQEPDGSYHYGYETGNGISAEEAGHLGQGSEGGTVAQGFYKYTSPEGLPVQIQYIANENGFQPTGNVIPTSPPIPIAILRSLEYNAAHPEPDSSYDGQQQYATPGPYKILRRS